MCGIAGVYQVDGASVDRACVAQAARLLRHRGPDGEGFVFIDTRTGKTSARRGDDTPASIDQPHIDATFDFAPDLALLHRRLAILDLSPAGHEPMTIADGDFWLTFNGEIYNYLELRAELAAQGVRFHTECDAEVLIQAYRVWGVDCLHRFVGMFAFALWDQAARRLFCARDHMGIKPFYYAHTGGRFAFASEIKAFAALTPAAYQPDLDHLYWFLTYGRDHHAPRTFFTGVSELPGGHYLLVEGGQVSEPVRWWDVSLQRARSLYDYARPEAEFLRLMRDSVGLQLRSDVPVGTCLSGGLDSSTIVALATERLDGGRMNSFSSVYATKGMDERRYIDLVAQRYNTIAHRVTPTPADYFRRLERITWHQDIPTATPTVYSQSFVMELAHGNVTVLLDGQGADEMFGGYLSYVLFHLKTLMRRDPLRWLPQQIAFTLQVWSRFNAWLNGREFVSRALQGRKPPALLQPELVRRADQRMRELPARALDHAEPLNHHLYLGVVRDSIPSLLHYEDRNSMAYAIEARVPFLDHRLVEFALGVPPDLKINGADTKLVMRRALQGVLPDAVVNRKDKLGYPTPFGAWLRGDLRAETEAFLFDQVERRAWFTPGTIRAIWRDHLAERRNNAALIHRLITAELWLAQTSAGGASR